MSTATDTHDERAEATGHGVDHPSDAQYIKIALILAAITGIEVALYYFELPGVNLNNSALGVLALVKFIMVAAYFMHLKFDSKLLRRLFITGLLLAFAVYIAYLLTMGVFVDPPPRAT